MQSTCSAHCEFYVREFSCSADDELRLWHEFPQLPFQNSIALKALMAELVASLLGREQPNLDADPF
jgi:hypothetical protein